MKSYVKRLLACILALAMVMGSVPAAFAETASDSPIQSVQFDDINVYEYTTGSKVYGWNEEEQKETPYYHYDVTNKNYTVVMKNGDIVKHTDQDEQLGFFYDDTYYSISFEDGQYLDNQWGIGSHRVIAYVAGEECSFNYVVNPCPIESVACNTNLIECSYDAGMWQEEQGKTWFRYIHYRDQIKNYTVIMKDGTVLTSAEYDFSDSEGESTKTGIYYNDVFFDIREVETDQSKDNQWGVGAHEAKITISGFTAPVTVNVVESPIKKIEFRNTACYAEEEGDYVWEYDPETGDYKQYFKYYPSSYEYKVTMKDGTVISSSEGKQDIPEWHSADFYYDGVYYKLSFEDGQSYANQWGVGKHSAIGKLGGCESTYNVAIVTESTSICDVLGHVGKNFGGYDATCTTYGETPGVICEVCQTWITRGTLIEPTGHKYGNDDICDVCLHVKEPLNPAPQPTPGEGTNTDQTSQPTPGEGTNTDQTSQPTPTPVPQPEHQHSYEKTITKATVVKDGSIVEKCACGDVKSTTVINKVSNIKLKTTSYVYNGKKKSTPKVIVKDSKGKVISSKNYTISKPKKVLKGIGKYTYTVKFKGNQYSGTKKLTLTIKPKAVTTTKPAAAKKAVTVKWKKLTKAQATGYQVMVATDKKFTKNVKKTFVKGYSKTSYKMTKLKAKRTYYTKVRTYKTVNGVKIYSDWSKAKKVKTK